MSIDELDEHFAQMRQMDDTAQTQKFLIRSAARRIEFERRSTMLETVDYGGDNLRVLAAQSAYVARRDSGTIIPRLFNVIISLSRNHAAYKAALRKLSAAWGEAEVAALAACENILAQIAKQLDDDGNFKAKVKGVSAQLERMNFGGEVGYPTVYNISADPGSIFVTPDPDNADAAPDDDGGAVGETRVFLQLGDDLLERIRQQARKAKAIEQPALTENWREVQELIDGFGDDIENRTFKMIVSGLSSQAGQLVENERVYQLTIDTVASSWDEKKADGLEIIERDLQAEAKRLDDDPAFISRVVTKAKGGLDPDNPFPVGRPTIED